MIMENSLHPKCLDISSVHNQIKDKQIPNSYPQLQGKIEAYNKIVKNEFLAIEDIPNIDDGKQRYDMFVKEYNETREHGGINGLTPSEMFLQRLITSAIRTRTGQQNVTYVGNRKCSLSVSQSYYAYNVACYTSQNQCTRKIKLQQR